MRYVFWALVLCIVTTGVLERVPGRSLNALVVALLFGMTGVLSFWAGTIRSLRRMGHLLQQWA